MGILTIKEVLMGTLEIIPFFLLFFKGGEIPTRSGTFATVPKSFVVNF
jgi:hypothetical protein